MRVSQNHTSALLSTLLFVLGALLLFAVGLLMGVSALASLFKGQEVNAQQTIFLVAFSFEAFVLLAAAFFTFQKYLQAPSAERSVAGQISNSMILLFVFFAGGALLVGSQISEVKAVDWLLLPVLTVPAVVLPLAILLAFGTRQLPLGTRWQTWNVLGLGMTLAPFIMFTLEIVVGIVIFVIVVVYAMANPALEAEMQRLSEQMLTFGLNSQAALDRVAPFLTSPGVIAVTLIYLAVLVPMIEEIFKPLGVWLLAGKLESRAQGFTLGALSGAGYAIFETINTSGQVAGWASLLFMRMGTGWLHITTSALMGAAIVTAWHERRYVRLLGTYFLAVLLHGLWNALAVFFTFSNLAELFGQAGRLSTIQPAIMIAMSVLAVGLFAILVLSNRKLRKIPLPSPTDTVTPGESIGTGESPE